MMIEFPFEVGVLGWASTLIFSLALGMIAYGVVRAVIKYNKKSPLSKKDASSDA